MDLRMVVVSWPEDAPRGAVRRFCDANKVSTSWFYKVRARAAAGGEQGLISATLPRSRAPHHRPRATPAAVEDVALRVRKELAQEGWDNGPLTVRTRMLALGLDAPSRSTLAAIFTRRGAVVPQPQKRPRSSYRRFCFPRPNDCWQLDGMAWWLSDGTEVCVLQLIDDHSRRIVASLAAPGETARAALAVAQAAIDAHGVPQRLLSDNGTAFNQSRRGRTTMLQRALEALGMQLITAAPAHPQTCGKNERAHQTLQRWLNARPKATDLAELQAQLDLFDRLYNTERPHQGIGMLTPMQAWNVTAKADPPEPPDTARPASLRRRLAVRTKRVDERGYLRIDKLMIGIGVEHVGHNFHLVVEPDSVVIFDAEGAHYRDITLEPGRVYYGSGQPRGGVRKPRLPSTKSSDR